MKEYTLDNKTIKLCIYKTLSKMYVVSCYQLSATDRLEKSF